MIAGIVTDENGLPKEDGSQKLSKSNYQPTLEVRKFYANFQKDYINAWLLQRRSLDEFDGYSLLDRARLDQETFGAFVGVQYLPKHKKWRFQGRKNTSRNKIIGILAHLLAGMLFPFVYAKNEKDEEDKMTARVMAIMIEEHLKRAGYEIKFMQFALSLLVNPSVFVGVEYVEAIQKVKQKLRDGTIEIIEAVDEVLSGMNLYSIPIDELLLGDLYSGLGDIHRQPNIFRVRRISYDEARSRYAGKYFNESGKDLFDYVEAGKTKWIASDSGLTLFDVDYTESDGNFVQEVRGFYRSDDLEVAFVGGVPMCNTTNIYNSNPFEHRRMTLLKDKWITVPIYPFAMSGFEPIDPTGRFVYYKSAAFKEYWDDKKLNEIDKLLVDGVKLDVMKPMFLSGVAKFDSTVMAPGATVAMPMGAKADAYSLGSNLVMAYKVIQETTKDLSESTQDKIMQGNTEKNITAEAVRTAKQQAQIFLGVASISVAFLVKQIGDLALDCIIQYGTIGELDASVPEAMRMKFNVFLAKGKDKGKDVTNRIEFSDETMGRQYTRDDIRNMEWALHDRATGTIRDEEGNVVVRGKEDSDQRIYKVNPYKFARTRFSMFVDADKITKRSMGTDRAEKDLAFERFMDPRVLPFINPQTVVNDFIIEEYSDGDPDRYKSKNDPEEMMNSLMGMTKGGSSEELKKETILKK